MSWLSKVGDVVNVVSDIYNAATANTRAKHSASLQVASNLKQLKRASLYGPTWQRQGFEDAGLNPALMYGSSASAPSAGSVSVDYDPTSFRGLNSSRALANERERLRLENKEVESRISLNKGAEMLQLAQAFSLLNPAISSSLGYSVGLGPFSTSLNSSKSTHPYNNGPYLMQAINDSLKKRFGVDVPVPAVAPSSSKSLGSGGSERSALFRMIFREVGRSLHNRGDKK